MLDILSNCISNVMILENKQVRLAAQTANGAELSGGNKGCSKYLLGCILIECTAIECHNHYKHYTPSGKKNVSIGPNICHHEMGITGFYSDQTSYLSMKVLTFAKDEMRICF